jgi:hypothetical protein
MRSPVEVLEEFWGYSSFRCEIGHCSTQVATAGPSRQSLLDSIVVLMTSHYFRDRFCGYCREPQAAVISYALAGNDSLVVMATGGGKSICYQLPPLVSGENNTCSTKV